MSIFSRPDSRLNSPCITRPSFLFLICILFFVLTIGAQTPPPRDNRTADRAAIRSSIEGITQAYLDGDVAKIYLSHAKDWTGFLGRARQPIIGVGEYMKFQGLRYPPQADATKPKPVATADLTIFRTTDFDVNFVAPNIGVAHLILEYGKRSGSDFVVNSRMRITDVYAKRKGIWIQVASHSSIDPAWQAARGK